MRFAGGFALESRENRKSHFRRKLLIRNELRRISRSFVQGITGAVRHARRGPHGRMAASGGQNAEMKGGLGEKLAVLVNIRVRAIVC